MPNCSGLSTARHDLALRSRIAGMLVAGRAMLCDLRLSRRKMGDPETCSTRAVSQGSQRRGRMLLRLGGD